MVWSYEMMVRPSSCHVANEATIHWHWYRYQRDNLTRWNILQKTRKQDKNTSEKYGIRIGLLWNELQEHKKGQTKNNKKG